MLKKGDFVYDKDNKDKDIGVIHSTYLYSVLVQFPHSREPMKRDLYKDTELVLVLHPSWINRYLKR